VRLARKLRLSIGFLGRLYTDFKVMIRAAERLLNFQELTICPLDSRFGKKHKKGKKKAESSDWSLNQTFVSLSEVLNDTSIKRFFGHKWTKHGLIAAYDKSRTEPPQVHTEVQLLLYVSQHGLEEAKHSGYIGCSKRSCFLCSKVLNAHSVFRTRGCHGKIYSAWTVPEAENVGKLGPTSLVTALVSTEEVMKNKLCAREYRPLREAKESTVGGSSIATKLPLHDSPQTRNLVLHYLKHQREDELDRTLKEL
jgi:nucleic acid/nucleotide deaminase of polymorphic system toxin